MKMKYDLSLIPTYECNLSCWFCMYSGGKENVERLDIEKARSFVSKILPVEINSYGFYGGEISINMPLYQEFINLVPRWCEKFTITNGSWSRDYIEAYDFMIFVLHNRLWCKISNTPEHKKHQNPKWIRWACRMFHPKVYVKTTDDTKHLLPMGRLADKPYNCKKKCKKTDQPPRIAMTPSGTIIFQSCDGVYPTIGNWEDPWEKIKEEIDIIKQKGCSL